MPESTFPRTATRRSRNCKKKDKAKAGILKKAYIINNNDKYHASTVTLSYLLVIWHLANENLSNLQRHVRVIVHLLLSENSDVSSNSEGERKNTFVNILRMWLW